MPTKLSDEYTHVWAGIPVPKGDLLVDEEDSFSFWYGDVIVGVNRNSEIFWRNRKEKDADGTD